MTMNTTLHISGQDGAVSCQLCAHRCRIRPGSRGLCGVRENRDGRLHSLVYGRLVAENADPVEKKPLHHFLPGSRTWSIATVGCNFTCAHCQNHQISQYPRLHQGRVIGSRRSPEETIAAARQHGCQSISYTYVEPTVFYEFARDCMALAHAQGLANIFVSNGYMTGECARALAPRLDAVNIDIKAFSEDFYRRICGARLQPVLDTVRLLHELGVWVEITTLLIPGLNDSPEALEQTARFICALSPDMPWHLSAFHPAYTMLDRQPTPAAALLAARKIALDNGLHFVYLGNVRSPEGANTVCPSCRAELIQRSGFFIPSNRLVDGKCPDCGAAIAGVWHAPAQSA
jgi:pyruvate formate lyase activating enzyme